MSGWKIVQLGAGLGEHGAAWDALNHERFGDHPLLASPFIDGLLREFGSGREYLCTLVEGATVRAMLILRRRSRFVWTSFLPSQCQLGPTLVPEAAMLDTLVASLPGKALQLDLLCNDPLLNDLLDAAPSPGRRMAHALTMSIPLAGSYADYWAARPRSLASNLRRYERRAEQDGLPVRLVRISDEGELARALERYVQLETAGWKGRIGTALGSTDAQYRFYERLLRQAAARGAAVAYELWLGDRLAASRLGLCDAGTLVMLKTSYDEELGRYAPGRLLLRAAIEDAFVTCPGGTIEFYTDASIDQLEWAGASRWIEHVTLFRHPALGFAHQTLKVLNAARRGGAGPEQGGEHQVEVYAQLEELPADTRAFLQAAEARNVGFGLDWYRNLVRTVYPDDDGVRLYELRRGGKPVAVLPLRLERGRGGWRAYSLSNYYTSLYEPVLAQNTKAAHLLPLLNRVRIDFASLGSLMLAPMAPGAHAYVVLLEALSLAGWFPFEFFAFGNWYQPVRSTWPEYLAERKSNLRNLIRRMGRKFAAEGGTLEVLTSPADMVEGIAAYEKVYAASWKRPEPFRNFVPGLLQTCAEKGSLRLGIARLHGEPIAAQAWIVAHGRAEIYKLAYDEGFKEYSPGTLVTAMLMQHVMEVDQVREIDHLNGDDPYKKIWMSERRERWGMVAYNLRSLPGLLGFTREALGRSIKRARQALSGRVAYKNRISAAPVKPLNPAG
jgi:CelD/BcsL family acetyltransferase involved in cellulose biosynthesis